MAILTLFKSSKQTTYRLSEGTGEWINLGKSGSNAIVIQRSSSLDHQAHVLLVDSDTYSSGRDPRISGSLWNVKAVRNPDRARNSIYWKLHNRAHYNHCRTFASDFSSLEEAEQFYQIWNGLASEQATIDSVSVVKKKNKKEGGDSESVVKKEGEQQKEKTGASRERKEEIIELLSSSDDEGSEHEILLSSDAEDSDDSLLDSTEVLQKIFSKTLKVQSRDSSSEEDSKEEEDDGDDKDDEDYDEDEMPFEMPSTQEWPEVHGILHL